MPEPVPVEPFEVDKLMQDPQALLKRLILGFALERPPRRVYRPRPARPAKPDAES